MTINIDPLAGFYIVGAIVLLVLTLTAFIAAWNEHGASKRKR